MSADCPDNEIHIADIGTIFRQLVTDCSTVVDISTATSLTICFQRPDLSVETVVATFTNVGTDGLMEYTVTTSLFLDQTDEWSWQGKIYFGAASPPQLYHTNVKTFEVFANICL